LSSHDARGTHPSAAATAPKERHSQALRPEKKHASSTTEKVPPFETFSPLHFIQGRRASTATSLVSLIESKRGAKGKAMYRGATSVRLNQRRYQGKRELPSGWRKAQRSQERTSRAEEEEEGNEPSGSRARAALVAAAAWASAVAAATAASRRARWSAERGGEGKGDGVVEVEDAPAPPLIPPPLLTIADLNTASKNLACVRATRFEESHMSGLMIWSKAETVKSFFFEEEELEVERLS